MFMLPEKKSPMWLHVFGIMFVSTLVVLLLSRGLLGLTTSFENILVFAALALVIGLLGSAGYLGLSQFSASIIVGNIIGSLYLFWIIFSRQNDAHTDTSSIFSMLMILAMSVFIGLAIQIVAKFRRKPQAAIKEAPTIAVASNEEITA